MKQSIVLLLIIVTSFVLAISASSPSIKPFKVAVKQDVLDNLKSKLQLTRFPPSSIPVSSWKYGVDVSYLKEFMQYWNTSYDWRKQEQYLNKYPQYTVEIEGVSIHFIHDKSNQTSNTLPMIMVHGWPGSFIECISFLDHLRARPEGSRFHFVCPSLPGYGFSGYPADKGLNPSDIARIFVKLMDILGYHSYVTQGGDWGSAVTTDMAIQDVAHCKAVHLNMMMPTFTPFSKSYYSAIKCILEYSSEYFVGNHEEYVKLWEATDYFKTGSGYSLVHSTKPDTATFGLSDSPIGLASYILEKFHGWSDLKDDNLESKFTKDTLITNLMIYWVTNSLPTSARLYFEALASLDISSLSHTYVTQPTGFAKFPADLAQPLKRWVEDYYNVVQFNIMPRGGHFAALEEPELLISDFLTFVSIANVTQSVHK